MSKKYADNNRFFAFASHLLKKVLSSPRSDSLVSGAEYVLSVAAVAVDPPAARHQSWRFASVAIMRHQNAGSKRIVALNALIGQESGQLVYALEGRPQPWPVTKVARI